MEVFFLWGKSMLPVETKMKTIEMRLAEIPVKQVMDQLIEQPKS